MSLPSYLIARSALSINVNGVFIPFADAIKSLHRFCKPVLIHKPDPVFDMAYSGSSFLFRNAGRRVQLLTRHQLKSSDTEYFDPSALTVPIFKDGKCYGIPPSGAQKPAASPDRDLSYDDIILVVYEGEENAEIDPLFIDINWMSIPTLRQIELSRVECFFTIGYPHIFTDFDIDLSEDGDPFFISIKSRWCSIYLQPCERQAFDLETRIPFKVDDRTPLESFDPDGLSGAPVFFVYRTEQGQAGWGIAGMITHGMNNRFQVYDGDNLRNFVLSAARDSRRPQAVKLDVTAEGHEPKVP
jgi:hypothetical protein